MVPYCINFNDPDSLTFISILNDPCFNNSDLLFNENFDAFPIFQMPFIVRGIEVLSLYLSIDV